jgi:Uri superfamily endonuclease
VWTELLNEGRPVAHLIDLIDAVENERCAKTSACVKGLYDLFAQDIRPEMRRYQRIRDWLDKFDRRLKSCSDAGSRCVRVPGEPPAASGTYILLLSASASRSVMIGRTGRLGRMAVRPGYYLYVGSAMGPGGLAGRLGHHLTPADQLRAKWQVDFLRLVCRVEEVWYTTDPTRRECQWAGCVRDLPGAEIPLARFGATDCNCPTHLPYFAAKPSLEVFRAKVDRLTPPGCQVQHFVVRREP